MNLPTAALAWAVIVALAAFYGIRLGYTGIRLCSRSAWLRRYSRLNCFLRRREC